MQCKWLWHFSICGLTCSMPVHLAFAHKCRQKKIKMQKSLDQRSLATFWCTARRSQKAAGRSCLSPSLAVELSFARPASNLSPTCILFSFSVGIWAFSESPFSPISPIKICSQGWYLSFIYIFNSHLKFCLLNLYSTVIWKTSPIRNYTSVSIQQTQQGQFRGMDPGKQ